MARFGDSDSKELFRRLLEQGMRDLIDAQLTAAIGAAPHERIDVRSSQRNGGRSRLLCRHREGIWSCARAIDAGWPQALPDDRAPEVRVEQLLGRCNPAPTPEDRGGKIMRVEARVPTPLQ